MRLRDRFDDPLFVRTPAGMEPTPLTTKLISLVEEGLLKFTQAIDQTQRFDPSESDRLFRVAINDKLICYDDFSMTELSEVQSARPSAFG
jgi:DNA-binding transcriptional LysR family regulator